MLLLDFAGLGFAAHRAFGASACEFGRLISLRA
jgi:hypothetical protein